MLLKLYFIVIILYFITFAIRLLKWRRGEFFIALLATVSNGVILTLIFLRSGHIPVFNVFESFLFVAFIMGILGLFSVAPTLYADNIRLTVWLEIVVLFGVTLFFPKEPAFSTYNYGYIYIILFYLFRYIALALMLYCSAYFIQFIMRKERDERTTLLSHQGRNFLLLSTVIFLMSEYAGIIWCQMGWGDFWSWSNNFFQSSFIVLYLMLAFHLPGKGRFSEDIKAIIGGLAGFVLLTLTIVRSFSG
jgi:hypothetical protein